MMTKLGLRRSKLVVPTAYSGEPIESSVSTGGISRRFFINCFVLSRYALLVFEYGLFAHPAATTINKAYSQSLFNEENFYEYRTASIIMQQKAPLIIRGLTKNTIYVQSDY